MKTKLLTLVVLLTLGLTAAGCAPGAPSTSASTKLASFTATTLDDTTFTEADIAAKDLTVINFWSTTCRPCISEMPDIAEFEKKLPDNVQFVTACLFGEEDKREAQGVIDASGFEGVTLLGGDGDYQSLCEQIQATPTTIFVNADGELVGDAIIGAQENFDDTMLEAINDRLADEGKAAITLG